MSKKTGLGAALWVDGNDIGGDVNQLRTLRVARNVWEFPDITQSAMDRSQTHRDGNVGLTCYFNDASLHAHPVLSTLPTTNRAVTFAQATALGSSALSMMGKQINYAPKRGADASLLIDVDVQSNDYGAEWGNLTTAGKITVTGAGNQTGVDFEASTAFGLQAWLHVFAFSGTDATVRLQESSDNGAGDAFANVSGGVFTAVTGGAPFAERIQTSRTLTVERYLRVNVATSGGFTSLQFAVIVKKNTVSTVFSS